MERVEVLGPLRIDDGNGAVQLPPAQRRLISVLLLADGAEVDRETLIDRMWGDAPPATAATALQVHVSSLRRMVRGLVDTGPTGYCAQLRGVLYDRRRFEEAAERALVAAQSGDWPATLELASDALRWWRGGPFWELRDDDFALPVIARLNGIRLSVLEMRARALMALDRSPEASLQLVELVRADPLREPLWELLILAEYRSGRRAEALRTYEELRRTLAVELGVEPTPSLRELHERLLAADPQLGPPATGPAVGLPAASTSFVGREDDVRRIAVLLEDQRLVTVVGGPGLGKTRLALEVAYSVVDRYPAGTWFASLSEARTRLEAVGAIVTATGVRDHARDLDRIARRLAPRRGLLIIDNCEHLVDICAEFVERVLAAGPALTVLATSRRGLGVEGERLWPIDPLALPEREGSGRPMPPAVAWAPVAASAAARLFVDRARSVDRTFQLTAATAPAIAELCRRADGIPLVLELAARWVQALGLDDIADMLESEPPGGRAGGADHHRSLAAAIEWSMALLPPEDRRLFILCAVFNGRFGLDDIRAVCAPGQERRRLARAVAGLVDASLLTAERQPDGTALYRLLAPIREFARTHVARSIDWAAARDRLATHYLGKSYVDRRDPLRQVVNLRRIDRDIDNLRQALEISLELGRADDAVRFAVATEGYWLNRYLISERSYWLERALGSISDPLLRATALRSMGSAAQVLGEYERSLRYFEQALPIFRSMNARDGLTHALLSLSGLLSSRGDWPAGLAAATEAAQIAEEIGSTSGLAIAAYYSGENLAFGGHIEAGLAKLEEATQLFQQSGELGRASYALSALTTVAALVDDQDLARQAGPRALALAEESASVYRRVRALGAMALVEARFGDTDVAGRMLTEARRMMELYELEEVFQFLLPAAFLLHRSGQWSLLEGVLRSSDAAIAASGAGFPRPWRAALEPLRDDLAGHRRAAGGEERLPGSPSLDQVTLEVMATLGEGGVAG